MRKILKNYVLEIVLLAIIILFSFIARGFFSINNLLNVLRNTSMQGIIAFGMTMVIIIGEIDLSVGSMVAFVGTTLAFLTRFFMAYIPIYAAILLSFIIVMILGMLVGFIISHLRNRHNVPSFITSLAFMAMLFGFANLISGGFPITPFPEWFNFLGGGYAFKYIPVPAVIFLLIFISAHILMNYTTFGRSVYAIGGNEHAARLSGINIAKTKTIVLCLTSVLMVLSGTIIASQIMSGSPTVAKGWELDVISAVIIGGASLSGGVGSIRGTLIGVLFMGVLSNGMTLVGLDEFWQYVVRGALIVAAVLINESQKNIKR